MKPLPRLAVLAAIVATSTSLGGCSFTFTSTTIDPTGAKVGSTVLLEDVADFDLVRVGSDAYSVVRTDPDTYGHIVEGYDRALGLKWKHTLAYDRDHHITPIWLADGDEGVTLIYNRFEDDDTLSIHGTILDPKDGTVRKTQSLIGINRGGRHSQHSDHKLAFSPDSSRFAIYYYDYTKIEDDGNKSVALVASLFDTRLNQLGTTRLEIPVVDHVDDVEDADPYVQRFFVANDGHGYQVSYHNKATMRITQLDFTNGTSRKLEQEIPKVDFDNDDMQLYGTREWSGNAQDVIVAASMADDEELTGVALVGMNFRTNNVDFVNMVEITETLANKLVDEDELEWFRLRDIIRMPGGEIVLPLEQVEVGVATSRDKSILFRTSTTYYVHQDLVMLGFNPKGESIWFAGQDRPKVTTLYSGYRSDAWLIEGDSIHYIYRDEDTDGLVAGSISTKTGTMTFPKPLMETSMIAENRFTKWLGRNNAFMVLHSGTDYRLVDFSY